MARDRKTVLLVLLGVTTLGLVAVLAAKTAGTGDDDRTAAPKAAAPVPERAPAAVPSEAPPPRPFVRRTEPGPAAASAPTMPTMPTMPTRIEPAPAGESPRDLATATDEEREQWRAAQRQRRQEMLATYDKDQDGELDEAERQTMRQERLASEFKNLDKNGDGNLSLEEFQAMEGLRGAGRRPRDRGEGR